MSSMLPSLSPSLVTAVMPRICTASSVVGTVALLVSLNVVVGESGTSAPDAVSVAGVVTRSAGSRAGAARAARAGGRLTVALARICVLLGALLAGAHVALDLVLALLAALVGGAQEVGGDLAAAEAERKRAGEGEHAEERGVGDRHDLRGDVELVEDHEGPDRQDEPGDDRAHDLAGGGIAHELVRGAADEAGERGGDHEDDRGDDDVRPERLDLGDEVAERRDLQGADGRRDREQEDEPEGDGPDELRRRGARADPLDVLACIALVEGPVEADLLKQRGDRLPGDLGDDEADEQDDQEAQDVRHEAEEAVEGLLDAVAHLDGGKGHGCSS